MCLALGHNSVTAVRLKPTALGSRVKHSTIEPLHSLNSFVILGEDFFHITVQSLYNTMFWIHRISIDRAISEPCYKQTVLQIWYLFLFSVLKLVLIC